MKITTNNQPRELFSFLDLSEAEQNDFDYIHADDQASPLFFVAYGMTHCLLDFELAQTKGWDGVSHMTYSSGFLIRLTDDGETVVVGSYNC
jgi:hypothetical protein